MPISSAGTYLAQLLISFRPSLQFKMQLSVETNCVGEGQHAVALHSNLLATIMMVNSRPEPDVRYRLLKRVLSDSFLPPQ
jgi:hypothetical protein